MLLRDAVSQHRPHRGTLAGTGLLLIALGACRRGGAEARRDGRFDTGATTAVRATASGSSTTARSHRRSRSSSAASQSTSGSRRVSIWGRRAFGSRRGRPWSFHSTRSAATPRAPRGGRLHVGGSPERRGRLPGGGFHVLRRGAVATALALGTRSIGVGLRRSWDALHALSSPPVTGESAWPTH
jgi:hypothetical protein